MAIKANQGKPRPSITPKTDEQRARTKELAKENKIKRENSDGETKENTGISKPPEESKAGFSKVTEDIEQDPKKLEQKKAGEQEKRAHDRRKLEANFKGEDRRIKDTSDRRIAGPASGQSGNNSLQIQGVSGGDSKKISQAGPEESSQNSQPRSKSDPGPQLKRQEGNRELLAPREFSSYIRGKYTVDANGVRHRTTEQKNAKTGFDGLRNSIINFIKSFRESKDITNIVALIKNGQKNESELVELKSKLVELIGTKLRKFKLSPELNKLLKKEGFTLEMMISSYEFKGIIATYLLSDDSNKNGVLTREIETFIHAKKDLKHQQLVQDIKNKTQYYASVVRKNMTLSKEGVRTLAKQTDMMSFEIFSEICNAPTLNEKKDLLLAYAHAAQELIDDGDLDTAYSLHLAIQKPILMKLHRACFGENDKNSPENHSFYRLINNQNSHLMKDKYKVVRLFCAENKKPLPFMVIAKDVGGVSAGIEKDFENMTVAKLESMKSKLEGFKKNITDAQSKKDQVLIEKERINMEREVKKIEIAQKMLDLEMKKNENKIEVNEEKKKIGEAEVKTLKSEIKELEAKLLEEVYQSHFSGWAKEVKEEKNKFQESKEFEASEEFKALKEFEVRVNNLVQNKNGKDITILEKEAFESTKELLKNLNGTSNVK